ncbi:MAG: tetratricopeptide repeat protein [Chitinispirillaceae bacterium]|nr:tetratricopeptide repeat protein [Chitinispirillaceae bacterium]
MSVIKWFGIFRWGAGEGRRDTVVAVVMLIMLTLLSFAPSLRNGFTNWDDDRLVLTNPDIHGRSVLHVGRIFSSFYLNHYAPLTMLSFMAEYSLFGPDPFPYHLTSLLLHVLNVLLVFALIAMVSGSKRIGLLTALLFAIHPLRVESVAWIAERKGLLCAWFYYMSLILYIRYYRSGRGGWYLGSLLTLTAALLSKSMAMSQPFVLLLLDYFDRRTINRKTLIEKTPFFLLAAAGGILAVIGAHHATTFQRLPSHERLVASIPALGFYVFKTIVPVNLCALYNGGGMLNGMSWQTAVMGMFILGTLIVLLIRSRIEKRKKLFATAFFLVTLAPALQILSSRGWTNLTDRYTYIPQVGLFYCFAEIAASLYRRRGTLVKRILWTGIAAILLCCVVLTARRCLIWRDSLTLWNDAVGTCPGAVAYCNRGIAWKTAGEFENAMRDLERAISLDSSYAFSYENRGELFLEQGNLTRAFDDFTRAISLDPNYTSAYGNRGSIHLYRGDIESALSDFQREIEITPRSAEAYYNRGLAHSLKEDFDHAIADYSQAIALDATYARAYHNRGIVFGKQGDHAHERSDLEKACALGFERACEALIKNRIKAAENY